MKWRNLMIAAGLIATARPVFAVTINPTDDPVLYWNDVAIKTAVTNPPNQARIIAAMNAAMYDAVNSAYHGAGNYYNTAISALGGDVRAAASQAAHDVLVAINPSQATAYDNALQASLAQVSNGAAKTNGIQTGALYAAGMVAMRTNDGSGASVTYVQRNDPGQWRPTPGGSATPAVPQWGGVTPFLLSSGSQFRPDAPPALGSAEYLEAYNEVKDIGSKLSSTRTLDQTNSALFWDVSNGTTWIRIGVDLIADDHLSTFKNAQIMAKLSSAVADSLIAGFDAKYEYNLWRPVSAIREGDNDGVAGTVGDATWEPLFTTPSHPSYVSTHSMQSGAASAVLLALVEDQSFDNTIDGSTRHFDGIAQAAQDAANSRLWGGIHFRFDNETGLATGQVIGQWALAQSAFNSVPEPANWAMMIAGFGLLGAASRRRQRVSVSFA